MVSCIESFTIESISVELTLQPSAINEAFNAAATCCNFAFAVLYNAVWSLFLTFTLRLYSLPRLSAITFSLSYVA